MKLLIKCKSLFWLVIIIFLMNVEYGYVQDISRIFLKSIDDSTVVMRFGRYRIELREGSDSLRISSGGIYWDATKVLDSALLDSIHDGLGRFGAETDPVWVSDSADYAFKTWVRTEVEDSLNEYSLTSAIASLYFDTSETVDTIQGMLPDTVPFAHHTRISTLWDFDLNNFTCDRATDSIVFDSTECDTMCGVHPDVEATPSGWPLEHYDDDTLIYSRQLYMIQTPSHGGCYENPTLYWADESDKKNWYIPFKEDTVSGNKIYAPVPLCATQTGGINTDPQILIGHDGKMYAYWRWSDLGGADTTEKIYVKSSSNGIDWGDSTLLFSTNKTIEALSPAVIFDDDGYYKMWTVNRIQSNYSVWIQRSATPTGFDYTDLDSCVFNNVPSGWYFWQHNVAKAGGLYVMVATMRDASNYANWLVKSYDGLTWTFSDSANVLTEGSGISGTFDETHVYTGDVVPRITPNGYIFDYWYSGYLYNYWEPDYQIGYTTIEFLSAYADSSDVAADANTAHKDKDGDSIDVSAYVTDANLTDTLNSYPDTAIVHDSLDVLRGEMDDSVVSYIKINQWYNILDYGAIRDDTINDHTTIQAALAAAGDSGGGIVYCPEGRFEFGDNIAIPDSVELRGAGISTIFKADSGLNKNIITITSKTGIVICDLMIDGNNANNDSVRSAIIFEGCTDFMVSRVTIVDMYGQSIGIGTEGNPSNNFTLQYCVISGGTSNHIDVNSSQGGKILYNKITGTMAGEDGIFLGHGLTEDHLVEGNRVDSANFGVSVANDMFDDDTSSVRRIRIIGNSFVNNQHSGVAFWGVSHSIIANNECVGNNTGAPGGSGIYLTDGHPTDTSSPYDDTVGSMYNVITGNRCYDTAGVQVYGLQTHSKSDSNFIVGNDFSGNQAGNYSLVGDNIVYQRIIHVDTIASKGNIYVNYDSAVTDGYLYFYESGSPSGTHLKWDNTLSRFAFSNYLGVTGTIEAYSGDVIAQQDMRINSKPNNDYGNLYFYEAGASDGAHFRFDTVNNRFEFSHSLGAYDDTAAVHDSLDDLRAEMDDSVTATNVNAAGAVMESDFDATTFLYATTDNTPQPKTPSEVRSILNVENGATSDQTDAEIEAIIGPFIDTTTLDTIAVAHKAVNADTAMHSMNLLNNLEVRGDLLVTGNIKHLNFQEELDLSKAFCAVPVDSIAPLPIEVVEDIPSSRRDSIRNEGMALHPSVIYVPGGWNRHSYWMAFNPWPEGYEGVTSVDNENPHVACSDDGISWTSQVGGGNDTITNPIFTKDSIANCSHLSDQELFFDAEGNLWLAFRATVPTSVQRIYVMSSSDGMSWGNDTMIVSESGNKALMSPSIVLDTMGTYRMWVVDGDFDPNKIKLYKSSAPDTGWYWNATIDLGAERPTGLDIWHIDVIQYSVDLLLGLFYFCDSGQAGGGGTNGGLYLAKSTDRGVTWDVSDDPLLEERSSGWGDHYVYRMSGFWQRNGMGEIQLKIYYSARKAGGDAPWWIGKPILMSLEPDIDTTDAALLAYVTGVANDTADVVRGEFPTPKYMFNLADPDALYATDHEWSIDPRTAQAITIDSFTVTLDADPTTELEFSLKFANAFIGLASATVIDDTATVAGVTTVTGGFGDATVPAGKCIYWLFDADPDDNITQASVKIYYSID